MTARRSAERSRTKPSGRSKRRRDDALCNGMPSSGPHRRHTCRAGRGDACRIGVGPVPDTLHCSRHASLTRRGSARALSQLALWSAHAQMIRRQKVRERTERGVCSDDTGRLKSESVSAAQSGVSIALATATAGVWRSGLKSIWARNTGPRQTTGV